MISQINPYLYSQPNAVLFGKKTKKKAPKRLTLALQVAPGGASAKKMKRFLEQWGEDVKVDEGSGIAMCRLPKDTLREVNLTAFNEFGENLRYVGKVDHRRTFDSLKERQKRYGSVADDTQVLLHFPGRDSHLNSLDLERVFGSNADRFVFDASRTMALGKVPENYIIGLRRKVASLISRDAYTARVPYKVDDKLSFFKRMGQNYWNNGTVINNGTFDQTI